MEHPVSLAVDRLAHCREIGLRDGGDRRERDIGPFESASSVRRFATLALVHGQREEHVGAVRGLRLLEVLAGLLAQDGCGQRAEGFAELHGPVDLVPGIGPPGVGQDAPRAEPARRELRAALEPADHASRREQIRHPLRRGLVVDEVLVDGGRPFEEGADLVVREGRPQQGPVRGVPRPHRARIVEELVPDEERHAEGAARIARRRLDPDPFEGTVAKQASIGQVVQGQAARETHIRHAAALVCTARGAQHDFLARLLHGSSDVQHALGDLAPRLPGRTAEELVEPVRRAEARLQIEIRCVQPKRAVVLELDQMFEDQVRVGGIAEWREVHQLGPIRVVLEPEVGSDRGMEQPQRVGEAQLMCQLDAVLAAHAEAARGPLADAIEDEDCSAVEGRRKEGRRRVRLVTLCEENPLAERAAQRLAQLAGHPELLREPSRYGLREGSEAAGDAGEKRLDEPVEALVRLLVEADVVELFGREASHLEACPDGLHRETRLAPLAREGLLPDGGDDLSVDHEYCGRVVVMCGDAENRCHGASSSTAVSAGSDCVGVGPLV